MDKCGYSITEISIYPCAFYHDKIILISWVDDCIVFAKRKAVADDLIKSVQGFFILTEGEDVSMYQAVDLK